MRGAGGEGAGRAWRRGHSGTRHGACAPAGPRRATAHSPRSLQVGLAGAGGGRQDEDEVLNSRGGAVVAAIVAGQRHPAGRLVPEPMTMASPSFFFYFFLFKPFLRLVVTVVMMMMMDNDRYQMMMVDIK